MASRRWIRWSEEIEELRCMAHSMHSAPNPQEDGPIKSETIIKSVQNLRIPHPLRLCLSESLQCNCLFEACGIIAKHLRQTDAFLRKRVLANVDLFLVCSLAWAGILFTIWHILPTLWIAQNEFLDIPDAQRGLASRIHESIWIWGISIPIFFFVVIYFIGRWRRDSEVDTPFLRRLWACELAEELSKHRASSEAWKIASRVFSVEIDTFAPIQLNQTLPPGEPESPTLGSHLIGVRFWLTRQQARNRRWWTEGMPYWVTIFATVAVFSVYFSVGVLPWYKLIYHLLQSL